MVLFALLMSSEVHDPTISGENAQVVTNARRKAMGLLWSVASSVTIYGVAEGPNQVSAAGPLAGWASGRVIGGIARWRGKDLDAVRQAAAIGGGAAGAALVAVTKWYMAKNGMPMPEPSPAGQMVSLAADILPSLSGSLPAAASYEKAAPEVANKVAGQ